jgi:hypothetical protein
MTRFWRVAVISGAIFPPLLALVTGPQYFAAVADELAWRNRSGPVSYLRTPFGGHLAEALAEMDQLQRKIGLVARLQKPPYPIRTHRAAWSADSRQLLTTDGVQIGRWDARTGALMEELGEHNRRQAEAPQKWGFGFAEAAFIEPGRRIVGLTQSGPQSLWTYSGPVAGRLLIGDDGFDQMSARGASVVILKSLEYGLLVDLTTNQQTRLPHEQVTVTGFRADGEVLTVSRDEVKRWRGGQLADSVRLDGMDHPGGLSTTGEFLLVPSGDVLELWDTASGQQRIRVPFRSDWTAYCANAETLTTGSKDGQVYLWETATGRPLRSFLASVEPISTVFCSATQLLTVSGDGREARLWELSGAPNANPVPPPTVYPPHWMVRWGADINLPSRLPWLSETILQEQENAERFGFIGLCVWMVLSFLALRWQRAR